MSISDRLAAITARAENATEGPWSPYRTGNWEHDNYVTRRDLAGVAMQYALVWRPGDAEFIAHARSDVPWLVEQVRKRDAALQAVLDLHKPVARFLVDGFEEVSYDSREQAMDETEGDPRAITEWTLCEECRRVEDGVDGEGPRQSGYINADYPCPTVRAISAALGEGA